MDELERLYNELPYFDKQKFIRRHLDDARQEDINDKASEPRVFYYSDLDPYDRDGVRMKEIEDTSTSELKDELACRGYVVKEEGEDIVDAIKGK
jgi:hypothetical protein